MALINNTCNKFVRYGITLIFISQNIMWIGLRIFINVIGKVLILVLMIGIGKSKKILLGSFRNKGFCWVGKYIRGG